MKSILLSILFLSCLSQAAPITEGEMNNKSINTISAFLRNNPSVCYVGYELVTESSTSNGYAQPDTAKLQAKLKEPKADYRKIMNDMMEEMKNTKTAPKTTAYTRATLIYLDKQTKKTAQQLVFKVAQEASSTDMSANEDAVKNKFSGDSCSGDLSITEVGGAITEAFRKMAK